MKASDIIKEKPYLVWHTKNYEGLSDESVVEAVLNYGDMDDVRRLIKILGVKRVAAIFRERSNRQRCNYRSDVRHYFQLYFAKYA